MNGDVSPRNEGAADPERLNGYLYRQNTRDFLFTADEWDNDEDVINRNFTQNLAIDEEENMSQQNDKPSVTVTGTDNNEVKSIHPENEQTEEERLAAEEEERRSKPFRAFTPQSYERLVRLEHERKLKEESKQKEAEGRLVDGEIVFDEATDEEKIERDPKLADGQPLPEKLGRFPVDLNGKPIEEIDKYIKEKTFVVISKKFKKYHIFRFSASKSLFCFSPLNPWRRFCVLVISNQFFDFLILSTIIINCFFMASDIQDPTGVYDAINENLEHVFLAVYTAELILKISARGLFLNKFTYLRDGWNWLDGIVVIISYVTLGMDIQASIVAKTHGGGEEGNKVQLQGLRAFRVMRTLKSISVVPGLRTIVNALLKSLKMLGEVMLLTLFVIAVFALLALQLYKGVLRQKCVLNVPEVFDVCNATFPGPGEPRPDLCFNSDETFRKWWTQNYDHYLLDDEDAPALCGFNSGALECPEGYTCMKAGDNPNWNYTNFDNFGWSMLNSFQLVTLDFWEDTYNKIIDVSGSWNMLFFMLIVLLGSFYLINLMLAVVSMAYEQEADAESKLAAEEEEEEKAKAKRKENTALLFDPKKLKQQLLQKQKDEEEKKRQAEIAANPELAAAEEARIAAEKAAAEKAAAEPAQPSVGNGTTSNQSKAKTNRPTTAGGNFIKTNAPMDQNQNNQDNMEVTELDGGSQDKLRANGDPIERGHTPSPTKTLNSEVTTSGIHMENNISSPQLDENGEPIEDEDAFDDDLPEIDEKQKRYLLQKFAVLWLNKIRPDDEQLVDRNCLCCAKFALPSYHPWVKYQSMVFKVANDGLFELFITLCILVNTIVMATEHYEPCELCRYCPEFVETLAGQTPIVQNMTGWDCGLCPLDKCERFNDSLTNFFGGVNQDERFAPGSGMAKQHNSAMEIANVVFTFIFLMEAVIKLTALSKEYFKIGWNVFDLIIVCFSLPDLVIYFGNFGDVQGLSALTGIVKIFRLMRIVKLAQSWSTFRTLLGIIFSTLGALVNLSVILVIIAFIFAVLGNQLLGAAYERYLDIEAYPHLADYGGELPRWHFQDFFHSFLMVFRILCGEWIEPLWDCMRVSTEAGCTFFFLLTLILGNFMVLNLFLALLLNAFSTDNLKDAQPEGGGESKIMISLRRIRHCCCPDSCCRPNKKRAVSPGDAIMEGSQMLSRPQTRLEAILDNGHRKPSVAINGSTQSIRSLIKATNPRTENGKAKMNDDKSAELSNGVELKPMNGHTRTSSRSGSIISVLSNGTGHNSNGVLKNKNPEMSDYNLAQIESAFSTQRDQYAKFETAVTAGQGDGQTPNCRTPIIITEDYSDEKRKTLYISEEQCEDEEQDEDKKSTVDDIEEDTENKDNDEGMLAEDGRVIVPDCFCQICHKNPKLHNCCGSTWNDFRLMSAKIVTNTAFEAFIMFLIGASSITLVFEDVHLHEYPARVAVLNYLNIVFAVFFVIEMLLKWLALGVKKYFTSFWCILDFLIVVVSLVDIGGTYGNLEADVSVLRVLRTLRALRPLRAISRWEGMRIVVNALIFAMPAIGNVLLVVGVLWLIFVILAVQTFRGKFFGCAYEGELIPASREPADFEWCHNETLIAPLTDDNLIRDFVMSGNHLPANLTECTAWPRISTTSWARLCIDFGGEWSRPKIHMDTVLNGYLALYQVATFEGWMEVMESAIDAPIGIGFQPFRESSKLWYWFFVIFIIFGAFFTLNLFIGVIIDNFNVLKKKYDGSYLAAFLSDNERHYYNTLKKLGKKKPQKTIRRPKNSFQGFFYDIAVNTKFEITITLVIFLNMLVMMLDFEPNTERDIGTIDNSTGEFIQTHPPPKGFSAEAMEEALVWINYVFTVIFVLEAMVKLIGLRLHYFRRAWNVFDFVVVALSVLGIVLEWLEFSNMFISPTLLRVVRVFRIGRVLRLVKAAKGIRKLLFALLISIPALINIATLLFLFMFIFAIMGMTFFSNVQVGGAITETVNFQTFGNSMVLLFRLSTSAGWNDVLEPLQEEINCNNTHYIDTLGVPQKSQNGNCGSNLTASIFLVFYLFVSFMVIINMYIAVILENFSQANEQEEIGITEDDFDMFYVVWEKFDPLATQYIKLDDLTTFIGELEDPLGIPKPNGMAIVAFNLPIVEGDRVHCLDIMMALVKRVLHTSEEETPNMTEEQKVANEKLKHQVAEKYNEAFPQRQRIKVLSTTMQRKKEDVAAKTLQRAWRKHKMRQNIMRIKELALESSQRGSMSHRLSDAFGSIKSRIGSAVSRLSRRGSVKSVKSIDSNQLNLPPELRDNRSNRLSPTVTPRHNRKTH